MIKLYVLFICNISFNIDQLQIVHSNDLEEMYFIFKFIIPEIKNAIYVKIFSIY